MSCITVWWRPMSMSSTRRMPSREWIVFRARPSMPPDAFAHAPDGDPIFVPSRARRCSPDAAGPCRPRGRSRRRVGDPLDRRLDHLQGVDHQVFLGRQHHVAEEHGSGVGVKADAEPKTSGGGYTPLLETSRHSRGQYRQAAATMNSPHVVDLVIPARSTVRRQRATGPAGGAFYPSEDSIGEAISSTCSRLREGIVVRLRGPSHRAPASGIRGESEGCSARLDLMSAE